MNDVHQAYVVVGVDGSRASRQAVIWAAGEARLRKLPLLIVHVEPPHPDAVGVPEDRLAAFDLLEASRRAAAPDDDLEVDIQLACENSPADALVRLSESAVLLAVGVDVSRPRWSFGARGPIEDRIAVHALCPVVAVGAQASLDPSGIDPVVLGWSPGVGGRLAMDAAAEEASLKESLLVVVRARRPNSHLTGTDRLSDDEPGLIAAIAAAERHHPGLTIDIRHVNGDPVVALRALSVDAGLLVVGCHHTRQPSSIRTGPVAQSLIRDGICPVMLVGHRSTILDPAERPSQTPVSTS